MTQGTHKRINITLPEETLQLIDRLASGNRSALIDRALRLYADRLGRAELKRRLKQAYRERAADDLAVAQEWEPLSREVWGKLPDEL